MLAAALIHLPTAATIYTIAGERGKARCQVQPMFFTMRDCHADIEEELATRSWQPEQEIERSRWETFD
ncbi:hypothetical protein BH11MYX2_BH11MYX2_27990 [soil metagenome]